MLIYGCTTGSKLGHFPKIANLFNQNGRDQNRLRPLKLVVQIVLILFDLVNLSFPIFLIFIVLR